MFFIDFFKKVFKLKNIGIIIWMIINLFIIIAFFPTTKGVSNGSEAMVAVIRGIVIYGVSVALALSPIGEAIFRMMNGCREISNPAMLNRLAPLFNEVYDKTKQKDPNLSQNIKLYMVDQPYPNAFALGRNTVCVTSGLMYLNDAEIKGIFAHEFAHLSNKDTDITLFIYVGNLIASVMFLILRVVLFIISFFLGTLAGKRNGAAQGFVLAAGLDAIYVAIIGLYTKLGIILVNYSSRNHEFEADKFAYDLGYGKELRDALAELQGENVAPTGFVANLMSTHPETYLRIEKLNEYLSGIFKDDSSSSINGGTKSETSGSNTTAFNKEETGYSLSSSNDAIDDSLKNGITFIDEDDIANSDKNISNVNHLQTSNENTKAQNPDTFNKKEPAYSTVSTEKTTGSDTNDTKNDNILNAVKNSYQETPNETSATLPKSGQKNSQDRMFYIGLFSLSFLRVASPFLPILHMSLFDKYSYSNAFILFLADLKPLFEFFRDNIQLLDVLLSILLVLLIIKLNKENRINELKRINYLSAIIGCCTIILIWIVKITNLTFLWHYYLIGFIDAFLLTSAITNGILAFKKDNGNNRKKNSKEKMSCIGLSGLSFIISISLIRFNSESGIIWEFISFMQLFFISNIYVMTYTMLLIILLISVIIKLNKENRMNELKRINYLSAITGSCMAILLQFYPISLPLWFPSFTVLLLSISAITNGILAFRKDKGKEVQEKGI